MQHWTNQYIGVPYSEMNCGELALSIQREVFQRDLPLLEPAINKNPFAYNHLIQKNMMDYIHFQLTRPTEGCCVLMKARKRLSHVGVYTKIGVKEYVIHSVDSFKSSVLHKIQDLPQYGFEVEGYYAWK